MNSIKMEVSKKENGAYVKQGEVIIFYPLLNELGLIVESTGLDKDGLPTYADEKVQYVFDSVYAAVKAAARNKLQSGTATLKDGAKIAETVEELLATADRSGEHLTNRRDAIKSFVAYVPTTGKSAAVVAWVTNQLKDTSGLAFQSQARRDLMLSLVAGFIEKLTAEQATKYSRFLTKLTEDASAAEQLDDDMPE